MIWDQAWCIEDHELGLQDNFYRNVIEMSNGTINT